MHKKYRDLHIKRLHEGTCSAYAGAIFLDLLSNLEINIANPILLKRIKDVFKYIL